MNVSVGDHVKYAPDKCHALDTVPATGEFFWEHVGTINGKQEVLSASKVRERIKSSASMGMSFNYTATKPVVFLDAVVVAVNGDSLDLDISHPFGHTLHYSNVPYCESSKSKGNTWDK